MASDRSGSPFAETADRLGQAGGRSNAAWWVLGAGMVLSAVLSLAIVRNVFWTIDELSWISLSPDFTVGQAFSPYVGHLIAIPRFVYWVVLEVNGVGNYWIFRVLTLLSIFLMVALLFVWLRRRVADFVALPFCLILLIFPVDHLHYLAGNGFVIALSLAFGLAALIAWDRGDTAGDVMAFLFLLLGMMTYTVSVPFAIGLALAAVIVKADRPRVWVGLVPLALYGLWRLVEGGGGAESETGRLVWDNLLLLPAWTFQSVGSVLAAMTGLGFDFSKVAGGPADTQGLILGPTLAALAVIGLAWRFSRKGIPTGFWLTGAILLALFASQVVVWGTLDARDPGAPRYLMPGAVMVTLVIGEVLRKVDFGRVELLTLWVVAAASLLISVGILARNTEWLDTAADSAKAEMTAIGVLETAQGEVLPPIRQPRDSVRSEYDASAAATYGYLGLDREGLEKKPGWVGAKVDEFLVRSLGIGLTRLPAGATPTGCRPAEPVPGIRPPRVEVSSPGAVILSDLPVSVWLGRFGSWPATDLGVVWEGQPKKLGLPFDEGIPVDSARQEWYIQARKGQPGTLENVFLCDPVVRVGGGSG